jgi:Fic family protein
MDSSDHRPTSPVLTDEGEAVASMTPFVISPESPYFAELNNLSFDLTRKSGEFTGAVPGSIAEALAELVRTMNCYYSNFIEGHNTLPLEIERALREDFDHDQKKRELQLEAKAHVLVQTAIDNGKLNKSPTSASSVLEIHERFCRELPEDLLWTISKAGTRERVVPGKIRTHKVQVGAHVPVSPGAIPRFLEAYENAYAGLKPAESVLNCAASHHRLLWIHPFSDGNGRVARLVSHAVLLRNLRTRGLWSVSRGLARNVEKYKSHLHQCDGKRWNDYDGRGARSERALAEFTKFFLEQCIDQVEFMSSLIEPKRLSSRVIRWAEDEIAAGTLPPRAQDALRFLLSTSRDIVPGDLPQALGVSDRHARRIISQLREVNVITQDTQRSPYRLRFPIRAAEQWLPGLFPSQ